MLFVVFQVGVERYAIAGELVVEILPAIHWTPVPSAPDGVAGIMNYHGTPLPLVDALVLLSSATSARTPEMPLRLHTRILVLRVGDREDAPDSLLAVLVDRVLGTIRREGSAFESAGPVAQGAPYLGPVLTDADGIVTRIEATHLLPASVRNTLLQQWSGAA